MLTLEEIGGSADQFFVVAMSERVRDHTQRVRTGGDAFSRAQQQPVCSNGIRFSYS